MFCLPAAARPTPGGNQVEEEEGKLRNSNKIIESPERGTARSAAAMVGNGAYFLRRILFFVSSFLFSARDQGDGARKFRLTGDFDIPDGFDWTFL